MLKAEQQRESIYNITFTHLSIRYIVCFFLFCRGEWDKSPPLKEITFVIKDIRHFLKALSIIFTKGRVRQNAHGESNTHHLHFQNGLVVAEN